MSGLDAKTRFRLGMTENHSYKTVTSIERRHHFLTVSWNNGSRMESQIYYLGQARHLWKCVKSLGMISEIAGVILDETMYIGELSGFTEGYDEVMRFKYAGNSGQFVLG
jgi:hypothetical protein